MVSKRIDLVRDLYDHIVEQEKWIYVRTKIHRQLYRNRIARSPKMDHAAHDFFYVVEQDVRNEIALALIRLVDSEDWEQEHNLSLRRLRKAIKAVGDPRSVRLSCTLNGLFGAYKAECVGPKKAPNSIYLQRQKKVGHIAEDYTANRHKPLWTEATWDEVDKSLEQLRKFLKAVESYLGIPGPTLPPTVNGDGADLLAAFRRHPGSGSDGDDSEDTGTG